MISLHNKYLGIQIEKRASVVLSLFRSNLSTSILVFDMKFFKMLL
ncbi:hypothetical protein SAMN04488601_10312 [Paenibacillus sp. 453mf]|nr:hypothetical protein SAMN04488601_10312 [Paenibacillus sp. 453mf]